MAPWGVGARVRPRASRAPSGVSEDKHVHSTGCDYEFIPFCMYVVSLPSGVSGVSHGLCPLFLAVSMGSGWVSGLPDPWGCAPASTLPPVFQNGA
eukprot:6795352-Pyramimonas_sp.AAC.1